MDDAPSEPATANGAGPVWQKKDAKWVWLLITKLVLAGLVVVFMVSATEATNRIQVHYGYTKPYFMTYFCTSFLIFIGLGQTAAFIITSLMHKKKITRDLFQQSTFKTHSLLKVVMLAPLFSVFWFLANYLFSYGVGKTNSASALSIEQLATVLVFIGSVIFLKERVTDLKLLSTTICVVGVVLIACADELVTDSVAPTAISQSLEGDLLVIGSTVATAAYMISYARLLSGVCLLPAVNTFLGLIGLSNILLFWPGLLIWDATGWETFEFPSGEVLGLLILSALLQLGYNYTLNVGIVIASPLYMRIATICALPVSFLVDTLLFDVPFNWLRITGAGVVSIGFVLFATIAERMLVPWPWLSSQAKANLVPWPCNICPNHRPDSSESEPPINDVDGSTRLLS
ncbi:solute carrier family 35, member F3/4 [Pelomyxa schiedti]|nr:solute carrier family 35, member F3/4 [Pelomyxa schiedti]